MTKLNIVEALEASYLLAKEGDMRNLGPLKGTAEDHQRKKRDTLVSFEDLLSNLWEDIEDYVEAQGGVGTLYDNTGLLPELEASDLDDILSEAGRDDIAIVLHLAEDHLHSGSAEETVTVHDEDCNPSQVNAAEAFDVTLAFIHKYGEDLFGSMIASVELPDNFFERTSA